MKIYIVVFAVVVTVVAGLALFSTIPVIQQMAGAVLPGSYTPVEWEHGFKTSRVIATRFKNDVIGWNIGFDYPLNPNDCDRAELDDFMSKHGGMVFESGGHPGARMYAVFSDVKDKESANRKLKEILPALSKLVASL